MKTIIAGSRELGWDEMVEALQWYCPFTEQITEVVSGKAPGIDTEGEEWAELNSIPIKQFPADWSQGRHGGYLRNAKMAAYADALIAIWDGESKGTSHMIRLATEAGLVVFVYNLKDGA